MKREIISLHIAVMLFGLAGVIGKFVSVPAILVTFGRVFFSSIFLLIIILIKKDNWKLKKRDYSYVIVAGIILAIHWFTFLQAIQIATVAIGTITFATFPIFVTFLEPLIYHEKLEIKNVTMAIIMFAGVLITVPEFSLANQMTLGIVVGMISAFSYAILCLFNRYLSLNYSGTIICLYEQGVATIILFPTIFFVTTTINSLDLGAIIFLGIVCTAIAHSIYVNSLKKIKVQTASIISSMESVYSIIFAFLLLNEMMAFKELLGGLIIIGVAIYLSFNN
ncbi:EamA family transporter [Erysipelatoclostridium sp. An15]|uniref:DMT family transporter n=1 Tax=Candidatus Erysipelatoclostridium merdavium TaxID=2838566 RepID=A0A9D2BMA5_9FIRM|nr:MULTISPECIES: DMT family transporter [unclassified Thomasclavelia]OUP76650.1 EamA family transporter [Erysipelatoclostridium sp. An173]OUQ07583.1 EamA family transporter [Erysipelatoclostridium sp. An15]HIX81955.1 DMT family transporter [Candidatus Erysipelatoclostridium merdavium]